MQRFQVKIIKSGILYESENSSKFLWVKKTLHKKNAIRKKCGQARKKKMKHAKRTEILVETCSPVAPNASHQEELIKMKNEKEDSIEIKTQKAFQHECSWAVMLVHATIDKGSEINQKLIDMLKEH